MPFVTLDLIENLKKAAVKRSLFYMLFMF